jgi:hypothetical protein
VARTCHLGNIAYKTGRRLYWNAEDRTFKDDPDAERYLYPVYRDPWRLPEV